MKQRYCHKSGFTFNKAHPKRIHHKQECLNYEGCNPKLLRSKVPRPPISKPSPYVDYWAHISLPLEDTNELKGESFRLLTEMEITIKEVKKSVFYFQLTEQLKTSKAIQENIKRVLGSCSHMEMVIYGLGSMEFDYISQYQLAIAVLLKQDFSHWIDEIKVFDPIFSPRDIAVLRKLGCQVLTANERCRRQVNRPTLFFMPWLDYNLYPNVIEANWLPSKINQVILLTHSLAHYLKSLSPSQVELGRMYFVESIQKYTKEIEIGAKFLGRRYKDIFNEFFLHFFDVKPNIDMQLLLPEPYYQKRCKLKWVPDNPEFTSDFRTNERLAEKIFLEPFEDDEWSYAWSLHRGPCKYRLSPFPTPVGWVKLNTSGKGWDEDSPAGYGGTFYDENKQIVAAYSGSAGEMDATEASLEGIKHGLRCLESMPYVKKLIVEGDDLSAIRWVSDGPEPPTRIKEALDEIFGLSERVKFVLCHIYQEANRPAMLLAEKGSKLQKPFLWISQSS